MERYRVKGVVETGPREEHEFYIFFIFHLYINMRDIYVYVYKYANKYSNYYYHQIIIIKLSTYYYYHQILKCKN